MEFTQLTILLLAAALGSLSGWLATAWAANCTAYLQRPPTFRQKCFASGICGSLFAALAICYLVYQCQSTPLVQPKPFWFYGRLAFQGALVFFLATAVMTDLRDFVIPDSVTISGLMFGVIVATASGDVQITHLWLDWHAEIPGIKPPWFPEWFREWPRLHGLAWSTAGALTGAVLAWGLRAISTLILQRPAFGMGDVTLLAMIGSYLGWQPTVCAFFLAPLSGGIFACIAVVCGHRLVLPYGPFLAAGAVTVLLSWRWLWLDLGLRYTFCDPTALVWIFGIAVAALVLLLSILRLYHAIPVNSVAANEQSTPTNAHSSGNTSNHSDED